MKKAFQIHRSLVKTGQFETARRLFRQLLSHKGANRLPMSIADNNDWRLARLFDPNNNGYSYSII